MNITDVQKMGSEAVAKLLQHLGPTGTVIILMGKADSDGPGVTTAMSGEPTRMLGVLEIGADIVNHDIRKALNIDHIPRR